MTMMTWSIVVTIMIMMMMMMCVCVTVDVPRTISPPEFIGPVITDTGYHFIARVIYNDTVEVRVAGFKFKSNEYHNLQSSGIPLSTCVKVR